MTSSRKCVEWCAPLCSVLIVLFLGLFTSGCGGAGSSSNSPAQSNPVFRVLDNLTPVSGEPQYIFSGDNATISFWIDSNGNVTESLFESTSGWNKTRITQEPPSALHLSANVERVTDEISGNYMLIEDPVGSIVYTTYDRNNILISSTTYYYAGLSPELHTVLYAPDIPYERQDYQSYVYNSSLQLYESPVTVTAVDKRSISLTIALSQFKSGGQVLTKGLLDGELPYALKVGGMTAIALGALPAFAAAGSGFLIAGSAMMIVGKISPKVADYIRNNVEPTSTFGKQLLSLLVDICTTKVSDGYVCKKGFRCVSGQQTNEDNNILDEILNAAVSVPKNLSNLQPVVSGSVAEHALENEIIPSSTNGGAPVRYAETFSCGKVFSEFSPRTESYPGAGTYKINASSVCYADVTKDKGEIETEFEVRTLVFRSAKVTLIPSDFAVNEGTAECITETFITITKGVNTPPLTVKLGQVKRMKSPYEFKETSSVPGGCPAKMSLSFYPPLKANFSFAVVGPGSLAGVYAIYVQENWGVNGGKVNFSREGYASSVGAYSITVP